MKLLISGGPGAGCTSTAKILGEKLGIIVFDSDTFFHKPTNPPFQEQYSLEERRQLLSAALGQSEDWIISGSIASWDVDLPIMDFGVFMDIPKDERLRRLEIRERERFGSRVDAGGDMHTENRLFMEWAVGYEDNIGTDRNRCRDRDFLMKHCSNFVKIGHTQSLDETAAKILNLLIEQTKA